MILTILGYAVRGIGGLIGILFISVGISLFFTNTDIDYEYMSHEELMDCLYDIECDYKRAEKIYNNQYDEGAVNIFGGLLLCTFGVFITFFAGASIIYYQGND